MQEETILIVDDDIDHLGLIKRYASAYGVEAEAVTGGKEALRFLEINPVGLIVTDMVMPEIDGMELLLHTRKHYPDTDVIIMTGYSQDYSYIDVIQAGAIDFISKPFKKDEFFAKLERALRERENLRKLTVAKEKAEVGDRAKTDFIRRISHEFKTPLTNIVGFTELLMTAKVESKSIEYKKIVLESINQLTGVIKQLLDFAKFNENVCGQKCLEINFVQLLEELFTAFSEQRKTKDLVFRHTIDELLLTKKVYGESVALRNILKNIIKNAVTFSNQGEIHVEVMVKEQLADNALLLQFAVHDTGCGIAEDQLALIFEPFTQVEEFLTRRHDGAGLGLAICAKLIKTLDGEIWVTSKMGEGSTFNFTLEMKVA